MSFWSSSKPLFLPLNQIRRPLYILISLVCIAVASRAQDAADFFRQNCVSCHTVGGGRLTGPDLKNVTQRKDREWLVEYLQSPQTMMDKGDPYALKLQQEARGVVMPTINGMSKDRAQALLAMLDAESKLPKSQFAGMQISDRPFTAYDISQGKAMFTGDRRLVNGGPPCISCHTVKGTGALGGGRLAPDLTRVYERLQGRKAMAAWLFAPATPTMSSVFRQHGLETRGNSTAGGVFRRLGAARRAGRFSRTVEFLSARTGRLGFGAGGNGRGMETAVSQRAARIGGEREKR